jgi:hypothetical protein
VEDAIGWPELPFQYAVHEPALVVWMNAMVRYLLPDACASPEMLWPVQASTYGAKTCAGRPAGAALAVWVVVRKPPMPCLRVRSR